MKQTVIIAVLLLISAGCQRNSAAPIHNSDQQPIVKETVAKQPNPQPIVFSLLEYKSKNEQIENLTKERNYWQNKYLYALDIVYKQVSSDSDKGVFLGEYLNDQSQNVRLWAIEKVQQWRLGTKSNLPQQIGQTLTTLVNDPNREIRLKVAKILSLMEGVDSADALLVQIKIEKEPEVKAELFVALVGACYYSMMPDSPVKASEKIQKQTYEMAAEYLGSRNAKNAQLGAKGLSKLLEINGISKEEVALYFNLFAQRYKESLLVNESELRADLLAAMASLCSKGIHKQDASVAFEKFFYEAFNDKNDLVRESAADGLINIDGQKALITLRNIVPNENNIKIIKKVSDLAGQYGDKNDIGWLTGKLRSLKDNSDVFKSILQIFEKTEADFVFGWYNNLSNHQGLISPAQTLNLLEIAFNNAENEDNEELIWMIGDKLAEGYAALGEFDKAVKILVQLRDSSSSQEQKEKMLARLLDVYLRKPNINSAVELVNNCLLQKDLDLNSPIVGSIERYFRLSYTQDAKDVRKFMAGLKKIKVFEPRPMWEVVLKALTSNYIIPQEPNNTASNKSFQKALFVKNSLGN